MSTTTQTQTTPPRLQLNAPALGPTFSIVVPVHNEMAGLLELHRRLAAVMDQTGEAWELVLVDDGSQDQSTGVIAQLCAQDERVRGISLTRNFGFQVAVTAGLDAARGNAVVLMDADLQDPPEVIPQMIEKWWAGYEVVYGVRAGRTSFTLVKMLRFALDAITSFSNFPLQMASYLGLVFIVLSGLLLLAALAGWLLLGATWLGSTAVTVVTGLLLGGVQLICLGVVGEYLGRMYDEIKGRPLYLVARRWGGTRGRA